ncbi:MAG TPA: helix-turn-helix domain-containing protein [Hanamia sp.]|nr:helix-turn-helix domain-containing protein [Hanamia sp.]
MSNEQNDQQKPSGPHVENILYTDKTLAKLLGLSVSTIRRYRRNWLIGYIKPAGKVFYTKEIIEEFLRRFRKLLAFVGLIQLVDTDIWCRMLEAM